MKWLTRDDSNQAATVQRENGVSEKRTRKSYELKCDLEVLYRLGESKVDNSDSAKPNAAKYTAEAAVNYLRNMRDEESRRKYRKTSKFGTLPSIAAVRQWFSGRASGKIKPFDPNQSRFYGMSAGALREECNRLNLPPKGVLQLRTMLELYDKLEGINVEEFDYSDKNGKVLTNLCQERDIPSKAGQKAALIYVLQSHEQVQKMLSQDKEREQQLLQSIAETLSRQLAG